MSKGRRRWCAVLRDEDLWECEMAEVEVDGEKVLLIRLSGGKLVAYQGLCPHQEIPLINGEFDGRTIVCAAHKWKFDAVSGKGINPPNIDLFCYDVKVEQDEIYVGYEDGVETRYKRYSSALFRAKKGRET